MGRTYNVIDSDGHVLEAPHFWQEYTDPAYRDRAPKIIIDDNGKERFEVEGKLIGPPAGLGLPARLQRWSSACFLLGVLGRRRKRRLLGQLLAQLRRARGSFQVDHRLDVVHQRPQLLFG